MIKNWAPGIATMATNHILDAGEDGLADSLNLLRNMGFKTTGAGLTAEEIERPLRWETTEGSLSIINWVFAETHPDWSAVPGPNCWPGLTEAKQMIQKLKRNSDWVLVVVHWSDELFSFPLPNDREIARELANMGADIVIGHHPHVVRGMEIIGNSPVFYSLGNFYFAEQGDQAGVMLREAPRNREGLGVKLTFQHGKPPEYELLSFWNNCREARQDLLRRASRRLHSTSRALRKYDGDAYLTWYKTERACFDKWTIRWHFGLMQRGLIGTLQRIVEKLFKLPLISR
jgi:poly-gamma-glutamate synthesis protein (capsule biosynthesis protein)